jgi:apolipoprotein D and lipocalin family protein
MFPLYSFFRVKERRNIAIAVIMSLSATGCLLMGGCATTSQSPPGTVAGIDLHLYLGRWYEIARLPMPFQRADEAALAEYGLKPDGTLTVHNVAIRPDGTQHDIHGCAKVLNPPENTKLAVRFNTWFGPLIPVPKEGNYWILYVDNGYRHAIVGTPDRKYLWILSRTPKITEPQYRELSGNAERLGFDLSRLIRDPRP